ncbi:unnamed protein product, partial [Choristocarpus tenellus]
LQKHSKTLQDVVEQLSANKADRRELLELKHFMVSLNERRGSTERKLSTSSQSGNSGSGGLMAPVTRDEMFNLLEEKADRKDLEKRMAAMVHRLNQAALRRGSFGATPDSGNSTQGGPAGPNGFGGTPAHRGSSCRSGPLSNNEAEEWDMWEPQPDGALGVTKQLTDGMGQPIHPDGMSIGTCLSCKVSID